MTYDRRLRRTKLVATIGPASSDPEILLQMIQAGVNVARINSAHGTPEERAGLIQLVRELALQARRHVGILVDLQGPRIRVGSLTEPRELAEGESVVFAPEEEAAPSEIPTTYEALSVDVGPGSRILLDDGLLAVQVTRVQGRRVEGVVEFGGLLRANKGINLPNVQVSAPAVTPKDRGDIELALANETDFIGVSFVRRAEDVEEVRALVGDRAGIVAKIELAAALRDLPRILEVSDGIMVARGDLGVELPFEEVPLTQKHLIDVAMQSGKPVITATQMLESMVSHPRPTRAEASDVANAILDGTDAVMLSAETAAGAYPLKAVEAMLRIIHEVEQAVLRDGTLRRPSPSKTKEFGVEDAIASASTAAAEMLRARMIVCITKSGFTARKIAANRPLIPILGLSTEWKTCRRLALVWGVLPRQADQVPSYEAMLDVARSRLLEEGYVEAGDRIAVTAGIPFQVPGTTNLLKVETV